MEFEYEESKEQGIAKDALYSLRIQGLTLGTKGLELQLRRGGEEERTLAREYTELVQCLN